MTVPRRQRRLSGRRALVDGIPFTMPVNSEHSPALMAAFTIDADRSRALLPGNEIHPLRVTPRRGLLIVTVIDYRITDIGKYIEFSIAIACTHGTRPAPMLLPGLLQKTFRAGQFVIDLPVSSEISVKGGKGIWGMPKHRASLDFTITDDEVSSQYDLDGRLAMRIEIDRPRQLSVPLRTAAVNYCGFRGLLQKSTIYFQGRTDLALFHKAGARLYLGDHPRMDALRDLDICSRPLFCGFLPDSRGVLDDHFESWFLTYEPSPATKPEGLESVVDLGLSDEWLDPPTSPVPSQEVVR
ncbi:MAG: acetoacetate decarboxylase family protein [Actinomycetota bacterium]|nr:acetoacetate decarboxylase family protein [Actinomycetota bacterium]